MSGFWLAAAAMLVAALAFVVIPLARGRRAVPAVTAVANVDIYRHRVSELEEEHARGLVDDGTLEQAKIELERSLLSDTPAVAQDLTTDSRERWPLAAVSIAFPALAIGLYLLLGSPDALKFAAEQAHSGGAADQAQETHDVRQMIARLEQRLADAPEDAEGWILLGRSYAYVNRYDAAARAYARASTLRPDDARLMADRAEALAVVRGNRIDIEVLLLVTQALQIDPATPKALWLAGLERYQAGERSKAAEIWSRLRPQLPQGSQEREMLERYIAQAGGESPKADQAEKATMRVRVVLAPEIARQASPDDVVFVFARAHRGPRMPVAIVRMQVRDLPAQVMLDDSQSMAPGMKLSSFSEVEVGARVSKAGDATPRPGDLEGYIGPIGVRSGQVAQVRIDRVVRQ